MVHGFLRLLLLPLLCGVLACNRIEWNRLLRPLPAGPSVLLVTIDTLRADHVGAYGADGASTPTLDRLAEEGVRFDTAISTAPLTLPSHATILTGRIPPHHGVRHNGIFRLGEDVPRLPERFQQAGYDTAAFVGAVVLAPRFGLAKGFDHYDAQVSPRRAASSGFHERTARAVTDAALAWLSRRHRPFFLWVHYYDPHALYRPPEPFAERFRGHPYDGEIAYVDSQLARLLGAVGADATVLVTADHGESLGEHGEATHAYTLYDATLHVPLLLRGGGLPAGRKVPEVVSTTDVAPTLLALAGLPPLPDVDGRDLLPLIRGDAPAELTRRRVYAETLATRFDHGWAELYALRDAAQLFVRAPRPELYDLARDPAERRNLLAEPGSAAAGRAAELGRALDSILAGGRELAQVPLDAETRGQLQALGYALPEQLPTETGMDPKDGLRLVRPYEWAKARYASGAARDAERVAAPLYRRMPDSPGLNDLLTLIYLTLNQPEKAAFHARRALELQPGVSRYHVLLGLAQLMQRDVEGALVSFREALAIDPDNADAHAGLMWRLRVGGSLEEAVQEAETAIALQPENADLRRLIADHWDRLGQYDRAFATYREAVDLDPENGSARVGLAVNDVRFGRPEEAARELRAAGAAAHTISARMRLAIAWAGHGDLDRSEELLRSVLRDHPDFAGAKRVLARVLERSGRSEAARKLGAEAPS